MRFSSVKPHSAGHARQPLAQQGVIVGVPERGAGVQQPQPDVGRPVAHAEDPAVPRQQPVAVPQVEPGLQVVVVVPRAGVVGPHRDAERPVVPLAQPHGHRQAGGVAVRRDDDPGPVGLIAVGLFCHDAGDAVGALVEHGAGHGDALEQPGAGLLGPAGEHLVQVGPGPDQAVPRVAGQLGPGQFQPLARADDAQALVADPAVLLADADAHGHQRPDPARGQAVPAHLLPRERGLLQHQDVKPGLGQVKGGRRTSRPGADHDDVGVVGAAGRPARVGSVAGLDDGGNVLGHG